MSGRCGGCNIDVQGYVIHCNNLFHLLYLTKKNIIRKITKMESQYHTSYDTHLKCHEQDSHVNVTESVKRN